MSSELKLLACFRDVDIIKKYLFNGEIASSVTENDSEISNWNNDDWGFSDNVEEHHTQVQNKLSKKEENWLEECILAFTPNIHIIALAKNKQLVLLSQKFSSEDRKLSQAKYSLLYEGSICVEEKEDISALFCIPFASFKKSTHVGPDWTCIVVGFSSGYVRFYTETGIILFSQIFADGPIRRIKCQTFEPRFTEFDTEKHEELTILYKNVLISIDGFTLFQSLRVCRSSTARSENMSPLSIPHKKWNFSDQHIINDYVACGLNSPSGFSQMSLASLIGGFNAQVQSTPPMSYKYICTGSMPFVAFYYAIEGSPQPLLSDVVNAVGSKLKSAFYSQISAASGWFGMPSKPDQTKEKVKPKIEPEISLTARFGLPDKRRIGETISLSPCGRLIVTTDCFGRIMIIDAIEGYSLRIWKGYRDAQVAWMCVKQDVAIDNNFAKRTLFLVILAPRRGILEVWSAVHGPRVAAFNVSKTCKLLNANYSMLGMNSTNYIDMNWSQVYLIDIDGSVKSLLVPFHLALSGGNSRRVRDLHLLKKLKISLKDNNLLSMEFGKEISDMLKDIKTANIKQQALERILITSYLSSQFIKKLLLNCKDELEIATNSVEVDSFDGKMEVEENINNSFLDYENQLLLQFCSLNIQLVETYEAFEIMLNRIGNQVVDPNTDINDIAKLLLITPAELKRLQSDLIFFEESKYDTKINKDFVIDSPVEFLKCFHCVTYRENIAQSNATLIINLHENINREKSLQLGRFLFDAFLKYGVPIEYSSILLQSEIPCSMLMELLLSVWLNLIDINLLQLKNLFHLFECIFKLSDNINFKEKEKYNDEEIEMWKHVREILAKSENPYLSITAALTAKAVALKYLSHDLKSENFEETLDIDWENITIEQTKWNNFIKKLEDLLAVQQLFLCKPQNETTVSVEKIMQNGIGSLSEIVAKWVCCNHFTIKDLITSEPIINDQETNPETTFSGKLIERLRIAKNRLQTSLDDDILYVNCAWEYATEWFKDPQVVERLEKAIQFLEGVGNVNLQHGVSILIWDMFLVKKLSATSFLVEKVGKIPKERLCRKDIGMSDTTVLSFLSCTLSLLNLLSIAKCVGSDSSPAIIKTLSCDENVWHSSNENHSSLVELALKQRDVSTTLLKHHTNLVMLLSAVFELSMKSIKPMSLFDSKGRSLFFKPLYSAGSLSSEIDESISTFRKQFLCKIITYSVKILGIRGSEVTEEEKARYRKWSISALDLGEELLMSTNFIVKHQIIQLLSSGWDELAIELLNTIGNFENFGSQLVTLAGQRLAKFILNCDNDLSIQRIANCPPSLSSWLKKQDPTQLRLSTIDIKITYNFLKILIKTIPDTITDYKLAISLHDLTETFI